MDWERAIGEERAALMRIATLLRALAALAELAAGRSAAVRGFVVWLLCHAEAVAWDFVADDPDMPFDLIPPGPLDGGVAEAIWLALSFRAMARHLETQAAQLLAMGGDGGPDRGSRPRPARAIAALRAVSEATSMLAAAALAMPHPAPDTSKFAETRLIIAAPAHAGSARSGGGRVCARHAPAERICLKVEPVAERTVPKF